MSSLAIRSHSLAAALPAGPFLAAPRVLVVEDEMAVAMLIEDMVCELDFEVAGVISRGGTRSGARRPPDSPRARSPPTWHCPDRDAPSATRSFAARRSPFILAVSRSSTRS